MLSITELLFHPLSNAIMTILAGITALYWIITFITGDLFGDSDVDVHVDTHVDVDGHIHPHGHDVDTHGDHDMPDSAGDKPFFQKALEFINIGKVPFMVVYSTFKLIAWIVTLTSSVLLGLASWGWLSILILIPAFLVAFFITRYATKPLVRIYNAMGYNGEESIELLGRTARMRSTISGNTIGAAEVKVQSDIIRINVKSKNGETIDYDAEVMIADESTDRKYYLVVPEINLSNIV